jgi:hypothetical protein
MDNFTFNHDKFNTWKKCQKRYFFKYIKDLNWPEKTEDYKLGTSIHRLMDYHLRGLKVDNLLNNADEDIKAVWNNIKSHEILNNKVIATEWGFNCRIGKSDYWINGRIDAVFYDQSIKKYIIADWKTGIIPKKPEDSFQHVIYLYAFFMCHKDLRLNISPDELMFQYIKVSGAIETVSIEFSQEKLNQYERMLLEKTGEIVIASDYARCDNCEKSMSNCQYKYLCSRTI